MVRVRMMSFCLVGVAGAAFCSASTILPLTATRSVGASVDLAAGEVHSTDENSAFSDTLDPFNETVAAHGEILPSTGDISATHISDITPLSIVGQADLSGLITIPTGSSLTGASMAGGAFFDVTFSLSDATAYTLVASASASSELPNSVQGIVLSGPGGTIVSSEGFDGFVAGINTAGVLDPGDYELLVYFNVTADAPNLIGPVTTHALGHFDVNFQVPEPASLVGLALLGLLARRR